MAKTWGPDDWVRLGEEIRLRREQLHQTQADLGKAAGLSENTIGNYERGRVPGRGKLTEGYQRVEAALHWGAGSMRAVLNGRNPLFAVQGPVPEKALQLRSPDDPQYRDNPFMQALLATLQEAITMRETSDLLADTAERWGATPEKIAAYRAAAEELMLDMVAPGRGPENLRHAYANGGQEALARMNEGRDVELPREEDVEVLHDAAE